MVNKAIIIVGVILVCLFLVGLGVGIYLYNKNSTSTDSTPPTDTPPPPTGAPPTGTSSPVPNAPINSSPATLTVLKDFSTFTYPNYDYLGEGPCTNDMTDVLNNYMIKTGSNCIAAGQQPNGCWHLLKAGAGTSSNQPGMIAFIIKNPPVAHISPTSTNF